MKIKVLRIIARLNVGGPAIHVILLTAGLDKEKYETVLVSGVEGPDEGNMYALAEEKGVKPVIVPNLGRELNPIRDILTLWKLYRLIRRERPDIVHTHTAKAGTVGRLAALLAGTPIIVHTFHGHVLHGYFGKAKTAFFRTVERFLARCSSAVIAVSESCRNDLIHYGIGGEDRVIAIPLGLELERFRRDPEPHRSEVRRELGIPLGAFAVGMIARMVPIKRHEDLFHAIPNVLEKFPDAYFVNVGDGELKPQLVALAQQLGIANRCLFPGFREDQERIYAAMDLTVLTSANEGLPVAVIESLSSGTPVVATRVGGVPELVRDGETGYIVEPGNPDSIAEGLLKAIADPAKTAAMGRLAQEETIRKYSIQRLIRDIEEFYGKLLQGK
ncbi:MAG: glycosyltransferase family 4 protein [Candidatus Omnitrophota bacterium]